MITSENFKKVLEKLGFSQNSNGRWSKKYRDAEMAVDFESKKLIYPTAQGLYLGRGSPTNFPPNENFVVFVCVCHLLEKRYRPEHIVLEPQWPLGHGQKGGRADILVKCTPEDYDYYEDSDNTKGDKSPTGSKRTKSFKRGKTSRAENPDLIIIECKTAGVEYNKERDRTEADGGQLFSYWQQTKKTKWLALYSADWRDNEKGGDIIEKVDVIRAHDDKNILKSAEVDDNILTYKKASTAKELFKAWDETYGAKWSGNLIFSQNSIAYKIGIPPLRKDDLNKDLGEDNKIVNNFEKILRVNNVSDKENAFNRLLALFICKLVDEKSDDDEVKFQYQQGDSYIDLQERLQELYYKGMAYFMKEDITYVPDTYADRLFSDYRGENRDEAIKDLKATIRKLKFYSNNDFAFKEVHNEELFLQNGKILVGVVQLFERYKIINSEDQKQQQLLGDLFEKLLNKGFKQNEGQFFTPVPITSFVWHSLPLKEYCQKSGSLPKIIDYACGAGHFLTEAIKAISEITDKPDNKTWVNEKIFGIEKDYRLARVSKVSMFMNGAGGANIIFGDGLENYPDKEIDEHSFDILAANPPFSVDGFRPHLNLKNNNFTLLEKITDKGGEIETLFVERIAQLLKPNGIAAVILPISFLNKSSPRSYVAAREKLLQNFSLKAIVGLGSKTFGATGTNTIILFLERYDEPPCRAKIMKDCRDAIMRGGNISDWSDKEVFDAYLAHQNITEADFRRFVSREMEIQEVKNHNYFKIYTKKKKRTSSKKSTPVKNEVKEKKELYDRALKLEAEKIYYFALAYEQQTLVITSPSGTKEQKDFLGYEWSKEKGKEGIHVFPDGGKLCDNRGSAPGTLANAIRRSFTGEDPLDSLDENLEKYAKLCRLQDMLDFSDYDFNKEIDPLEKYTCKVVSKYKIEELGSVCDITIGATPSRNIPDFYQNGTNLWVSVGEMNGQVITDTEEKITNEAVENSSVKLVPAGTTLLSFKLSIGKTAIAGVDLYTNEAIVALIPKDKASISDKFLFYLFNSKAVRLPLLSRVFGNSLNRRFLSERVKIPIPPMAVQAKVVSECEEIDKELNSAQIEIDAYAQEIVSTFKSLKGKHTELQNLDGIVISKGKTSSITKDSATPGEYKVVAAGISSAYTHNQFNREPPVITISASGASSGFVNLWRERIFASDCTTIKCKTDVETVFVFYYLKNCHQEYLLSLQKGASQPHVHSKDFENISIPKISPEEQQAIVAKIDSLEQKIAEAREKVKGCERQKQVVFDKHLEMDLFVSPQDSAN